MTAKLIRVVPVPSTDDGKPTSAMGTQIFCGGQEIIGVTKITLTAEVGTKVWKANIECFVVPPEIRAECDSYTLDATSVLDSEARLVEILKPKG